MGDYYDFEIQIIDGKDTMVFCYQNKGTGYEEVIVQMSEQQCNLAIGWHKKHSDIIKEKDVLIKSFLGM
jgi:hypothetical protein